MVATPACAVSIRADLVSWHLVTAADERQRCCVVVDGHRCEQASVFRVASSDDALDDYTYVCGDHVLLVTSPTYVATRIAGGDTSSLRGESA